MTEAKKAVVLLSGGLDSATLVAIAHSQGFVVHGLSFRYGQRHSVELNAAKKIAESMELAEQKVIDIDLRAFGGSALTADINVPKDRTDTQMENDIPITYVPARNTIFLSFALAYAEVIGAKDIFIGVNAVDYSGYPDCRPEFITAYEKLANIATKAGVEDEASLTINAPLLHMSKAEIITLGTRLGVNYGMTISCYDPRDDGAACGHCDSCLLRKKGFNDACITDPTYYSEGQ